MFFFFLFIDETPSFKTKQKIEFTVGSRNVGRVGFLVSRGREEWEYGEEERRKMAGSARQVTRIVTGPVKTVVDRRDVFSLQLFDQWTLSVWMLSPKQSSCLTSFFVTRVIQSLVVHAKFHQPYNCLEPIGYQNRDSTLTASPRWSSAVRGAGFKLELD